MKKTLLSAVLTLTLSLSTLFAPVMSWAALTWSAKGKVPLRITDSMNAAVAAWNTYSDYKGNIEVSYNPGVPTAQTDGYRGLIEFGGSTNERVAEHEISHWLGCGTYKTWGDHSRKGVWNGANGIARVHSFDGPTVVLHSDGLHFWPYDANYDNEPSGYRHIATTGAILQDMGLTDTTKILAITGTRRLQNRADGLYLDTVGAKSAGSPVGQYSRRNSRNQLWKIVFTPDTTVSDPTIGYYTLQSVSSGKFIDSLGNIANGSTVGQWDKSNSWNQLWVVTPTDAGYFNIVCRASAACIDTGGKTAAGDSLQNWGWGNSPNQQWRIGQ